MFSFFFKRKEKVVIYLVIWWDIFGKVGCFWVMFFWKIWRIAFCQLPFDGERKKLFSVQQIQYKWLSVFNANVLVQSKLLELQGLASWKLHKIEVSWCVFTWNLSSIVFSWNAPWPGNDWQWSYSHLHPADDGHYIVYLLSLCCGANHEEWCYEGDLGMNFRSCESFPKKPPTAKGCHSTDVPCVFHPSNVHFQENCPLIIDIINRNLCIQRNNTHTQSQKFNPLFSKIPPLQQQLVVNEMVGKQLDRTMNSFYSTSLQFQRSVGRRSVGNNCDSNGPSGKIDTNQTCGILS